jgi:hypothetical protein
MGQGRDVSSFQVAGWLRTCIAFQPVCSRTQATARISFLCSMCSCAEKCRPYSDFSLSACA